MNDYAGQVAAMVSYIRRAYGNAADPLQDYDRGMFLTVEARMTQDILYGPRLRVRPMTQAELTGPVRTSTDGAYGEAGA